MKSALELAMEKADKVTGGVKSLTASQKERIAEIRSIAEAKVAEDTIMLDKKLKSLAGQRNGFTPKPIF